jgi:hypothetical protein
MDGSLGTLQSVEEDIWNGVVSVFCIFPLALAVLQPGNHLQAPPLL